MSMFGNIVSKLFGHSSAHAAEAPPTPGQPAAPGASPAPAASGSPSAAAPLSASPAAAATPPASAPLQNVDVTAILDGLVAKHGQKLDWRRSIVDLLKTLDMDSSMTARKELAAELHYTGSTEDSAAMNVWLIKQVIVKLAENGGKLPTDLLHTA